MIDDKILKASLKEHLLETVNDLLSTEGFIQSEITRDGVITLVNLISDYYEEGKRLYPEVVITNDMSILKTFPSFSLIIDDGPLNVSSFKQALKLCAPLAIDGWTIFIEIRDNKIQFGLFSTDLSEISLTLSKQIQNKEDFPDG